MGFTRIYKHKSNSWNKRYNKLGFKEMSIGGLNRLESRKFNRMRKQRFWKK